jgi:serine/threonine protein phosphatase PrpC
MVPDEDLFARFQSVEGLEKTVRQLIDVANDRGGVDNITAILVEVAGEPAAKEGGRAGSDAIRRQVVTSGESTAVNAEAPAPPSPDSDSKPQS